MTFKNKILCFLYKTYIKNNFIKEFHHIWDFFYHSHHLSRIVSASTFLIISIFYSTSFCFVPKLAGITDLIKRRRESVLDQFHDTRNQLLFFHFSIQEISFYDNVRLNLHRIIKECIWKIDNLFVPNRTYLYAFMLIRQFIKRFLFMDFYMLLCSISRRSCCIVWHHVHLYIMGLNILCES